jgi:hypothetical protein
MHSARGAPARLWRPQRLNHADTLVSPRSRRRFHDALRRDAYRRVAIEARIRLLYMRPPVTCLSAT